MPPPWAAMSFRSGYRSRKPSKIIRDEGERRVEHEADRPAQVVPAHVHEVGAGRLAGVDEDRQRRGGRSPPRSARSASSVRLRPATLARTITPTAPSSQLAGELLDRAFAGTPTAARRTSGSGRGSARWASAIEAFDSRAAAQLTASPPQYTFGQVSETIETSIPASSIVAIRRS